MDARDAEAAFEDPVLAAETLGELFELAVERDPGAVARRYKGGVHDRSLVATGALPAAPDGAFRDLTYRELRTLVGNLAAGFRDLGVGAGDRVAVFAETRLEWAAVDLALLSAGGAVVTVYPGAAADRAADLLADAAVAGVVVDDRERLDRALDAVGRREQDLAVELVVAMDDLETGGEGDSETGGEIGSDGGGDGNESAGSDSAGSGDAEADAAPRS